MGRASDKEILKNKIKSQVRELINGRKLVKGVNGQKKYETYYVSTEELKQIGYDLVDYLDLEDRVRSIQFRSLDPTAADSTLARYFNGAKKICFDYVKIYSDSTKGANQLQKNSPHFAAKVNLEMLINLAHELIHAKQSQITLIHNTFYSDPIISLIYRITYLRRSELEKEGLYKMFYHANPREREAYIRSHLTLSLLLQEIKNDLTKVGGYYFDDIANYDELIYELNKKVNARLYSDYDYENPMQGNAFNKFMEGCKMSTRDFDDITDTFGEIMNRIKLDLVNERELTHYDKLILGLPVKEIIKTYDYHK